MGTRLRVAQKLAFLARWLPGSLRQRFGDEIEDVLAQQLRDAAATGWPELILVFLVELVEIPALHARERLLKRQISGGLMQTTGYSTLQDTHETTPWRWVPVALLTFFISPLVRLILWPIERHFTALGGGQPLYEMPAYLVSISYVYFAIVVLFSALLVAAWLRGFPSWSYPLAMMYLAFSFSLGNASMPGLTLFGLSFGRRLLGPFALLPLGVVIVVALLLTRRNVAAPFQSGARALAADPSRLSFALYGLTPFFLWMIFDEMHGEEPFLYGVNLLLAGCGLVWLRNRRAAAGVVAMLGGLVLSYVASAIYQGLYWEGRMETWMREPGDSLGSAIGTLVCATPIIILTLGPWLIYWVDRRRNHVA